MDAYVIRVYRTQKSDSDGKRQYDGVDVNGVIEHSETGQQESFHDAQELWNILAQGEVTSANKSHN
ncbi:hypothetical protein KAR91_84155 [Candidatus Pacearchaeota archaeon]|nr:hypothetical protein [Candidatus Pacearchaeota archaeon]